MELRTELPNFRDTGVLVAMLFCRKRLFGTVFFALSSGKISNNTLRSSRTMAQECVACLTWRC